MAHSTWPQPAGGRMESSLRSQTSADADRRQACRALEGKDNANPAGRSFRQLIAEDFATHDRSLLEPGFWAVVVHRFGNWRMGIRYKLLRAPFSLLYQLLYVAMRWCWGIELGYNVRLGRRVRLWHHGGMWIGAASIGDDVHLRHNTTFGVGGRDEPHLKPVIGDRVDVGPGVCILGPILVGDDCVIGANSVVVRDVPPGTHVFGVPARPVNLRRDAVHSTSDDHATSRASPRNDSPDSNRAAHRPLSTEARIS